MAYPPVDIVDENDQVIGSAMLAEVWEKGYRHRVVGIIIENDKGEILLQKRGPEMILYPNTWDISAGGHVDTGMTYEEAALRELEEEADLHNPELETLGTFYIAKSYVGGQKANRFARLYKVHSNVMPQKFAKEEISEMGWFSVDAIKQMIEQHPEQVANGLHEIYEHVWA